VNLARSLAGRAHELQAPLVLVLTYDEEVGTLGARHFVEHWPGVDALPRRALIGEPTSLRAVRMHKGHTKLRFTFTGESAHSGYPHLGRNAIEPAARAVAALAGLRDALALERPTLHEHFSAVPFVALNVGCIHGGSAVNVVPERCVVEVGFRPLPRMDHATVIDRMQTAVAAAAGDAPFSMELTGESPAMIGAETALYEGLREAVSQREEVTVSYTTDGGWFQRAGLECVVFGPGTIEVAHRPNEYLPLDDFARAEPLLAAAVQRACLKP
jgi:acetylornithine deacetylase